MTLMHRQADTTAAGGILWPSPDIPFATTRGRGWAGVTLDVYRDLADCENLTPARDYHLLCYCSSGSARLTQGREGTRHTAMISAGVSLLVPAGRESSWEGDVPASARMRIPTSLIAAAAEQMGVRSTSTFEVRNIFARHDLLVERIALTLVAELDRAPHPAQTLIADTLSCALAAHLLRSYNVFDAPGDYAAPPLCSSELARLTEYVEENIDRSIGLDELAGLVNVSRFHFARMFKRTTGMTAIRYVERCRIRRAQALIADTDLSLAEIALMTGFSDQSHFTRRFQRHVGRTPGAFSRERGRRRSARKHH